MTILILIESNNFGKVLTSNIMLVIHGEYPDPQPRTPETPIEWGPIGGLGWGGA